MKTLELENEKIAQELHRMTNLSTSTEGDLSLDNSNLVEKAVALRLDLENQGEAHRLELSKLKQSFKTKRSVRIKQSN